MIVAGNIREKGSQTLIQGAKVTLSVDPRRPETAPSSSDIEIAVVRSGSTGFFRLEENSSKLIAGQTLAIHVEHPDYEPQRVFEAVRDQVHVDIELDPRSGKQTEPDRGRRRDPLPDEPGGLTVSGFVRDSKTRDPIDNAKVKLAVGATEVAILRTHRDGYFKHREGPPTELSIGETLTIRADHPDYVPWQRGQRIGSSQLNIDIELRRLPEQPPWWRRISAMILTRASDLWRRFRRLSMIALAISALAAVVASLIIYYWQEIVSWQDTVWQDTVWQDTVWQDNEQTTQVCSLEELQRIENSKEFGRQAFLAVARACLEQQDLQTRFLAIQKADEYGDKRSTLELAKFFDPLVEAPDLPPSGDEFDTAGAAYDAYTRVTLGSEEDIAQEARDLRKRLCDHLQDQRARGERGDDAAMIGC